MRNNQHLQRFIDNQGISARLITCSTPTPTVADAARVLAVTPSAIIKSLVFIAAGKPCLLIIAGEARVDFKRARDALGVSRRQLRMASSDEALAISGFSVGAMPPFGHQQALGTLLDSQTLPSPDEQTLLYGGGGTTSSMLEVDLQTLLAVTKAAFYPLTS